ncbi:hypothetical protein BBW65_04100 [Helicobacter enhydrae]|uniref:Glycosyltransferase 2-like domain-containing protein n=1 Tax=Helicobacter enhydrae TaxID=222136 RepID=A0A1B1U5I3_9HELI|nr:glycosyltransferase family 2 protein [Helicobacter enhydrae]ANV98033.1 hypothetical protein BBW65_04100 [Helicobacter enhydrae]
MCPKISVITTTFNSQETIKDTLQSILEQNYKNIECIIIDGASQDQTLNIIQKYKEKFDSNHIDLKIFSEKDKGIYDAMNKGIQKASGDVIGFLNSDDFFFSPDTLLHIAKAFNAQKTDCVFGNLCFINDKNKITRYWIGSKYTPYAFFLGWHPAHPTFYAKREIFEQFGYFNLHYTISADYDLMLRFLQKYNISSSYIPHILVTMRIGGTSNKSFLNIIKANLECFQSWRNNKLSFFPIFIILKPIRKLISVFKAKFFSSFI